MIADLIFFFQAEDGIRDYKVTGVQTCALPISKPFAADSLRAEFRQRNGFGGKHWFQEERKCYLTRMGPRPACICRQISIRPFHRHLFLLPGPPRELQPMFINFVAPILRRITAELEKVTMRIIRVANMV